MEGGAMTSLDVGGGCVQAGIASRLLAARLAREDGEAFLRQL
jgi:hypothetical protein